jgi:outer membrane protein, multidrug efflux system
MRPLGSAWRCLATGDDFETSVDLAFKLDLWGPAAAGHRGGARGAAARRGEPARRPHHAGVRCGADVLRLLELDHELEIARRTLQTRQESLQLHGRRFQRGVSSQLDIDRG